MAENEGGVDAVREADVEREVDAEREMDEGQGALFSLHVFVRGQIPCRRRAIASSLMLLRVERGRRVLTRFFGFILFPGERT